jgi:hypothetical protein
MTLPGTLRDGGFSGLTGTVRFCRRFGRPTNLGAGERVWLVFEAIAGQAEVELNDARLGPVAGAGRFDVTDRLAERNLLTVVLPAADDEGGIVGDVVLEIRRDAG